MASLTSAGCTHCTRLSVPRSMAGRQANRTPSSLGTGQAAEGVLRTDSHPQQQPPALGALISALLFPSSPAFSLVRYRSFSTPELFLLLPTPYVTVSINQSHLYPLSVRLMKNPQISTSTFPIPRNNPFPLDLDIPSATLA